MAKTLYSRAFVVYTLHKYSSCLKWDCVSSACKSNLHWQCHCLNNKTFVYNILHVFSLFKLFYIENVITHVSLFFPCLFYYIDVIWNEHILNFSLQPQPVFFIIISDCFYVVPVDVERRYVDMSMQLFPDRTYQYIDMMVYIERKNQIIFICITFHVTAVGCWGFFENDWIYCSVRDRLFALFSVSNTTIEREDRTVSQSNRTNRSIWKRKNLIPIFIPFIHCSHSTMWTICIQRAMIRAHDPSQPINWVAIFFYYTQNKLFKRNSMQQ